ncbi:MAG: UDP-N-acetylglucosamine 2-epimerase (non-hydrolyzing) [Balneola sp.]|nr:MAG: UDP-N-acetylglucosamine 2-epimerase (non-hydrolyzing) [Balneola sp.]
MNAEKLLIVFGTRPEAIKMAPVIKEFKKYPKEFEVFVCVTAQHREMLDQVLDFFSITPDYDLDLMIPNQRLDQLTSKILEGVTGVIDEVDPDYVYVHGDTTTTLAASLAAFYKQIKVGHVEAGLRTFNKSAPFPEEINRQLTSRLADLNFAPTQQAKQNLLDEGVDPNSIFVTGNTVVDALHYTLEKVKLATTDEIKELHELIDTDSKLVLVTGHRRENFGEGFKNICEALREVASFNQVQIIYPVHLNPNVREQVLKLLGGINNIHLIDPLPYEAFVWLMNESDLIITDSGGIQEEAPSLKKPVLLMREVTERPEVLNAGVILVGAKKERIISEADSLLKEEKTGEELYPQEPLFGDGNAAKLIVENQRIAQTKS